MVKRRKQQGLLYCHFILPDTEILSTAPVWPPSLQSHHRGTLRSTRGTPIPPMKINAEANGIKGNPGALHIRIIMVCSWYPFHMIIPVLPGC
jgi:hypothetical protein